MLASNIGEISVSDSYRALGIALAIVLMLMLIHRLTFKDWHKAAAFASLAVIMVSSYGHIYEFMKPVSIRGTLIGRHRYLIPLWISTLSACTWVISKRLKYAQGLAPILNAVAAALLLLPGWKIAWELPSSRSVWGISPASSQEELQVASVWAERQLPDIYYIIPDSYARQDILSTQFDYDNSDFIGALQERGFYVASESASNYLWTHTSLASSLNATYLQTIGEIWSDADVGHHTLIQRSFVRDQLEKIGYSTIAFPSGWKVTELVDADYYLTPDMPELELLRAQGAFNRFESLLMHLSIGRIFEDMDTLRNTPAGQFILLQREAPFEAQRMTVLGALENLQEVPSIPGPKFVFAHIISPHGPYLFGADGQPRSQEVAFSFAEAGTATIEEEFELYLDQLTYLNKRLLEVVDSIISKSNGPLIILIQADHGPGMLGNWRGAQWQEIKAAIFSAYLLPPECGGDLHPQISPVNSFRVVLNCILESEYTLLDDVTYAGYDEFVALDEILEEPAR